MTNKIRFEDLAIANDKGIQSLLLEIEIEKLILGLLHSSDAVKNKIYSNVSQRAAEILKEMMVKAGPVDMADVTAAQAEVVFVCEELVNKRKMTFSNVQTRGTEA
jgi:flagellar motor switch protein FliG